MLSAFKVFLALPVLETFAKPAPVFLALLSTADFVVLDCLKEVTYVSSLWEVPILSDFLLDSFLVELFLDVLKFDTFGV